MKKLLLGLLLSFIFIVCYAQNNPKKYYEYINKAELAICDFKYEKASKFYEKAFKVHPPFINDLVNATRLNLKFTRNFNLSLKYSITLLQRDFEIDWAYEELPPKDSMITKQYKILKESVQSLTDKNLIKIIEEMGVDDQKYRTNYEEYDKNRTIDSINYLKLIELFSKKGYLTEQNIGLFQHSPIKGILIHTAQHQFNPRNLLFKNVIDGDVNTILYMKSYDIYMQYLGEPTIYCMSWLDVYISNGILFINYPNNIAQFNEERKKINMSETWEDYVKKVKYQFLNGNFQFYTRVEGFYEGNEVEQLIQEIDQEHQKGIYKREYIRREK